MGKKKRREEKKARRKDASNAYKTAR